MFDILNVYHETIENMKDELSYDEFEKKMYETFFVEDIAAIGGLPYQISGQYDTTAMSTVMHKLYEGELSWN